MLDWVVVAAAVSVAVPLAAVAWVVVLVRRDRAHHALLEQERAALLEEAQVREAERTRLADQLLTAEQDERRRLAVHLHDTSVQSLSGIALMLDAVRHQIDTGELEQARTVLDAALTRHRETIKALRDLSFNLEPIVLRDQGFEPAVRELAEQLGIGEEMALDLDLAAAYDLNEKAAAALYQIIREALHQAIRRGPPTRVSVRVERSGSGDMAVVIADDAPGERRRRTFEALEERARTIGGTFDVAGGEDGGTTVRVTLPSYVAHR